ncbi:LysR family transcriptional regulator [Pendulispora brunnea]|uniref:LysR family transcriptional regulator n=1 Tax=Pendulispora brunnea TaxID=2905690 RepID=A0ABZ2K9X3_9BACT
MQSADANLLLALDALLREGSVTGAARRMNISPPAMSHTLARLRAAVGDPLFVRAGNRLVPTPRALAMRDRVGVVANEIDALLRPEQPLDVATLERTFVIRASDAVIVTLGRVLEMLVRREAPRVALHFVASTDGLEVDLDIGVQHGRAPDVRIQRLYQDDLVPVVRQDHPWAGRRISPKRLTALEEVAVATKTRREEALRKLPSRQRGRPPSRIVPSFLAAASLVRESDAYTVLPARLAAIVLGAFGLRRLSVTGTPSKLTFAQAWSPRLDNDAGHTWFRGCVRRACTGAPTRLS